MGLSRRALPVVLTAVAAGVVLGVAVTALEGRTYRATAVLQAVPAADPRVLDPGAPRFAADVLAATYAELLSTSGFRRQVAPLVGVRDEELEGRIRADRRSGTALLEVSADGPSRASAEELAAGVANAFLSLVRQLERQRLASAASVLDQRNADLTRRITALRRRGLSERSERVVALRGQREAVQAKLAELTAAPASVSLVGAPRGTAERIRPDLVENLVGGLVLGLVGGLAAALLPRRRKERLPSDQPVTFEEPEMPQEPEVTARPPAPPAVSVLAPPADAVLRGRVPLVARASGTATVRFLVSDGSPDWRPLADVPPGTVGTDWDTTSIPDGHYWLSAIATNGAGLSAATDPLPVRVENQP